MTVLPASVPLPDNPSDFEQHVTNGLTERQPLVAWSLSQRTNNALSGTFFMNNLNELTTATKNGTLTVAGTTTIPATNFPLTTGPKTYTAIAQDGLGGASTNSVTINVLGSRNYTYDANGNLTSDGVRNFAYDDENQLVGNWVSNAWSNSEDSCSEGVSPRIVTISGNVFSDGGERAHRFLTTLRIRTVKGNG